MASRFIIGKGELLTYPIDAPKKGMGEKNRPYTLNEAQEVIIPQIKATAALLDSLPDEAKPQGISVAKLILHPAFIAKSYFPNLLLKNANLVAIGSKTELITPRKQVKKNAPPNSETTQIFVAGTQEAFNELEHYASSLNQKDPVALQFAEIEEFSAVQSSDRVKLQAQTNGNVFEVALHLLPYENIQTLLNYFVTYANSIGFKVVTQYQFIAGGLLFLAVEGSPKGIERLALFSLMRVIRPMPFIRANRPIGRGSAVAVEFKLPTSDPMSKEPRVAILDGGLPEEHILGRYINRYFLADEKATDVEDYNYHGLGVTSAFLFGPIEPGSIASRPYAYVDHHRVLDTLSNEEDPYELYRTLQNIEDILSSKLYQFINLSLGPDLAVEDGEVHAWTAIIDGLLSDGNTLMTVAVGNNGKMDKILRLDRVQVPSDCVNVLSVGATDHTGVNWSRAEYSARGPGRSPGRRKPDVVGFGGCAKEYFHHVVPGKKNQLAVNLGTSFASPYVLRTAVGIRAVLGNDVRPLTIKALLIHASESHSTLDVIDIGWGRVPEDLNKIITCEDGVARIIFQGVLKPGKFLRAPIPLPKLQLEGKVKITATFCYASPVDAQDASAYTKAGLEITFRPNKDKFNEGAANPASKTFFSSSEFKTEAEMRDDLGKWETVLHADNSYRGTSLIGSTFDIHYNAREGGGLALTSADQIPYALIVTVEAPKHPRLYEEILGAHALLKAIEPQVAIPLSV